MDIKFTCKGMFYANEIADVMATQFGFAPEVSTVEGAVVVHPRPRALKAKEVDWLREYLEEHPQKSSEEQMVELEQADVARREELVARVQKFRDGTSISVTAEDMRDALGAVMELVGVKP